MAKSIKLGADTYLDASGVVVDSDHRKLSDGAVNITSLFTWGVTGSRKLYVIYDPVSKTVRGNMSFSLDTTVPATTTLMTIPNKYLPSSNTRAAAMINSNGTTWLSDVITFYTNGSVEQGATNLLKEACCSFEYKV